MSETIPQADLMLKQEDFEEHGCLALSKEAKKALSKVVDELETSYDTNKYNTAPLPFVRRRCWGYETRDYVWICGSDYTRMVAKDVWWLEGGMRLRLLARERWA
jgi:hypothetical protein